MKKIITLVMAFVLCMSMGMVAFASPVDPTIPAKKETPRLYGGSGTDKDGNKVTAISTKELEQDVKEMLQDEQKVKDVLTEAGYVLKGDETVAVLAAGDISLDGLDSVPAGGVDLELALFGYDNEEVKSLKNGDKLYILHQKKDGTWEVLEGTAVVKEYAGGYKTYAVSAHFDSLSPVAIIKVMSNGEVAILENNKKVATVNTKTGAVTKTSTVKTSPKTGA